MPDPDPAKRLEEMTMDQLLDESAAIQERAGAIIARMKKLAAEVAKTTARAADLRSRRGGGRRE